MAWVDVGAIDDGVGCEARGLGIELWLLGTEVIGRKEDAERRCVAGGAGDDECDAYDEESESAEPRARGSSQRQSTACREEEAINSQFPSIHIQT